MDVAAFWSLIDETRAASGDDIDRHAGLLTDRLASLPPSEIQGFVRIWRERSVDAYTWKLWAAAYVINGGCSDDCFDYFRDYLISLGPNVYKATLDDPDSLASVDAFRPEHEVDWEVISYVAYEAHERATGEKLVPFGPYPPRDPAGAEWDEDDLDALVPRLTERFDSSA